MNRILVASLLTSLVSIPAFAMDGEVPPNGSVEFTIRRPDGAPLANSAVEILTDQSNHWAVKVPPQKGTTDERGRIKMPAPGGESEFSIRVPGVGYGRTGIVEVFEDKTVQAVFPPLAPYGIIEGRVEGWRPEMKVRLRSSHGFDEQLLLPEVKDGAFRIEAQAEQWWIRADEGEKKRVAEVKGAVNVRAGETKNVVLRMLPDEVRKASEVENVKVLDQLNARPGKDPVVWAEGVVKDENGQPVAGANVYAVAVYHGGMRMEEDDEKTVSDESGHYVIKATGHLSAFSATLVAHKPGKLPAYAWILELGSKIDFVLPLKGGNLDVTVILDGKPAGGVSVSLYREGGALRDVWARGGGGEARQEVGRIVEPVLTTKDDGTAHFEQLAPGRYSIMAVPGDGKDARRDRVQGFAFSNGKVAGKGDGIAVRAGETSSHRLAMLQELDRVPILVVRHDGKSLGKVSAGINFGSMQGGGWNSSIDLDADGLGQSRVEGLGLWHEEIRYWDGDPKWHRSCENYYAAAGVVAASPALAALKEPVRLTATRFVPGSLVVELKDADGKPMRGVVELEYNKLIASTDATGRVEFNALKDWKYTVCPHADGIKEIDWGGDYNSDWLPTDQQFLECMTAMRQESAAVQHNKVQHVVCQAVPVGYIRGELVVPKDAKPQEFNVYLNQADYARGARSHILKSTGEFAAGPFPPGKLQLRLFRRNEKGQEAVCGEETVTAEAGKITRVKLTPTLEAAPASATPQNVMMGMGGISSQGGGAERLKGNVFMPDGKTPALGAIAMFFEARKVSPTLMGIAGADGILVVWHRPKPRDQRGTLHSVPRFPLFLTHCCAPKRNGQNQHRIIVPWAKHKSGSAEAQPDRRIAPARFPERAFNNQINNGNNVSHTTIIRRSFAEFLQSLPFLKSRASGTEREHYANSERVEIRSALLCETLGLRPHTRLLRQGSCPPLRTTWFSAGDHDFLYSTGFVPELNAYSHGHVPSPLRIVDHAAGDTSREELLRDSHFNEIELEQR